MDPDDVTTIRSRQLVGRCQDCAAEVCRYAPDCGSLCKSCAETRRLLPRYLSLVRGRAHVRELLAEIDALDA